MAHTPYDLKRCVVLNICAVSACTKQNTGQAPMASELEICMITPQVTKLLIKKNIL
jgi:hypothetical protein